VIILEYKFPVFEEPRQLLSEYLNTWHTTTTLTRDSGNEEDEFDPYDIPISTTRKPGDIRSICIGIAKGIAAIHEVTLFGLFYLN
jgi:hypothetical protein